MGERNVEFILCVENLLALCLEFGYAQPCDPSLVGINFIEWR